MKLRLPGFDFLFRTTFKTEAKSQYVIYQKLFYDENFPGEYEHEKYHIIKEHLK